MKRLVSLFAFIALCVGFANSQNFTLKGKVIYASDGAYIIGATVEALPKVEFTNSDELLTVKMRYKLPAGDKSMLFEKILIDKGSKYSDMGVDFRFAAAVAAYSMWLADSPYLEQFSRDNIVELATAAKGSDDDGYRAEFVRLVKAAKKGN